jgi:hypothetical protein
MDWTGALSLSQDPASDDSTGFPLGVSMGMQQQIEDYELWALRGKNAVSGERDREMYWSVGSCFQQTSAAMSFCSRLDALPCFACLVIAWSLEPYARDALFSTSARGRETKSPLERVGGARMPSGLQPPNPHPVDNFVVRYVLLLFRSL